MQLPKYCRWENERKFLVHPSELWILDGLPSVRIEDRYLACGRLRLRAMLDSTGARTYKLAKKFPSDSPYAQPLVCVYLDASEHAALSALDGVDLAKTRYHSEWQGRRFGIDVFEGQLAGLVMCEIEADTVEELMSIAFPPYAVREVTENPFFTGGHLCKVSAAELRSRL